MDVLIAASIGAMFGIGVFQMLRRNVIRSAIGLVIVSNAVNLFLIYCGAYDGVAPPYVKARGQISDPLPQALVLTAIVIATGGFAFVLAMLYVFGVRYRTGDMRSIDRLRN
jgi:multicomponent Na+:H+ antiporter subunit C